MQEKILSILAHHRLMTLATNRPDGWPQATSMSYVNRGLILYLLISKTSQKFANIMADDRVSICIASASPTPSHFEGQSMSARAIEPQDEPYRAEIVAQMRSHHPEYFDTAALDMNSSAVFRALPQVISMVDFSKGLGHSDAVKVNGDQSLEMTDAKEDDWGPDPARRDKTVREGAGARSD